MRMDGQEESSNVEDARGSGGGGGGGFSIGGGGIGLGTVAVALVAGWIFGINPLTILGLLSGGGGEAPVTQSVPAPAPPAGDPQAKFVSQVLRSTEVVWTDVFRQAGQTYEPPKLRLFSGSEATACGRGDAAMGPFYCPGDRKVYLDMNFFAVMSKRLGAPGQFAQAYVVAHEVGHHVQNLLGITGKADAQRQRSSEAQANAMSVRIELQADCFAGVWAKRSQSEQGWRLEQGDIETALNAASQIGDDNLQRKSRGTVVPESFTHGTSAQRVGWFKRGFESGSPDNCNTFESRDL
ncbi:MAG TPA: neutral zinc metallopeptidase [Burkholderiaceae bacterium]|nr:neutral zinc metallopeptidase [Burkholderiaceae bacterium]